MEGTPDDIQPAIPDDVAPKKGPKKRAALYHISDETGKLVTKKIAESPFEQSALSPDDCYIIDNGSNGAIYVWKGTF